MTEAQQQQPVLQLATEAIRWLDKCLRHSRRSMKPINCTRSRLGQVGLLHPSVAKARSRSLGQTARVSSLADGISITCGRSPASWTRTTTRCQRAGSIRASRGEETRSAGTTTEQRSGETERTTGQVRCAL